MRMSKNRGPQPAGERSATGDARGSFSADYARSVTFEPVQNDSGVVSPGHRRRLARVHAVAAVLVATGGDEGPQADRVGGQFLEHHERTHYPIRRCEIGA